MKLLVFACAATALSCGGDDGCDFEAETRELGGFGVTDCGLARQDDTSAVDRCAVMARGMGSTFRALYEQPDGSLEALVLDDQGEYALLRTPADGSRIERADCASTEVVERDGRRYVECTDRGAFDTSCQ